YKVKLGEIITGSVEDRTKDHLKPEKIDLDIIFEDDYIIVINKPPGLVVHPGSGNRSGTLVNALLHHYPEIVNVGDDKSRAGIVHRLDKNTSGVIVVAKTKLSLEFLKKEFKQRRVKKKYFALLKGLIKGDTGKITLPIGRHPQKRIIMATKGENLRYAETIWKVKQRYKDATLVEALLKTGRTHQIRVHFYETGYPLIGEKVYQFRRLRKKKTLIPRQMLHSVFLSFRHPYSGRAMSFSAPLPDDFKMVLDTLSSKNNDQK
ncbi:MAG: RluA family pseudouridine synthase, partial [Desulfobacteraceae bacterium]|nr:RluA family pseudouridine synthase [Desulfobacteraceae bacterium]